MKVKWLGHAAFLITSESGTRWITDPYTPGGPLKYGEIKESADIVTASHNHGDHNNVKAIQGSPKVATGDTSVKGINIKAILTFHDEANGKQRGPNTIFCVDMDGMRLCHLGDLGHELTDKQLAELGKVDILFIPAGGFYTMAPDVATMIWEKIGPRAAIPMHFKNEKCTYPISPVDEFLKGKKNVKRVDGSEIELKAGNLPQNQIIVLKPSL